MERRWSMGSQKGCSLLWTVSDRDLRKPCASPAADPERIAELKRQQQELDPFQLSRTIQAKCRLGGRRERRPDPLSP